MAGNPFDQFDQPTAVANPFDQFDPGAKPDETGDTTRGFKVAIGQTALILKGVVGLVGATAEKTFGEGGIATGIKNWGLNGFNEGMQKLQPLQRDTDELTTSWDRAKQGDLGALVDWVQYGLGYAAGQAVEAGATSIVGGLIGSAAGGVGAVPGAVVGAVAKGAVKDTAMSLVKRAVAKESERLIAEAAAQGTKLEAKAAVQAATRTVAGNIGSTSALLAYGGAQELGSIYPEAEAEAQKRGEKLSGGDLARVWATGILAGGIEGLTDKLGVEAAMGRVRLPGAQTRLGSAALTGLGGVAVEGGTEAVQTGIERVGAGQEVFSPEGIKDIINSAGQGALGGGAIGGGLGLLHPNLTGRDAVAQHKADTAMDELAGATTIDAAIDAAQRAVPPLTVPEGFDSNAALARLDASNDADVKGLKIYGKGYGDVPTGLVPVAKLPVKPGETAADSEVVDSPFSDRLFDLRGLIEQPRVRQQVRDTLGSEALGDLLYYASRADDASLPGKTSDRMLQVAEALLTRAQVTQMPAQPAAPTVTSAPAPSAGPALPAPTQPLAIGLDTAPTGVMRVDSSGNAAPEVRADVVSLRDRARAMADRRNGLTASVPRGGEPGAGVMVGDGTLTTPQRPVAETRALPAPDDFTAFPPESGSLGVPRAEMPQIRAPHHGPLVNFLTARDIPHQVEEVDPTTLKATQAEFSPAKVREAIGFQGEDRAILVSSDGYVLDGHHRWMAKLHKGEPIRVIRFDAPIRELVATAKEFPSAEQTPTAEAGKTTLPVESVANYNPTKNTGTNFSESAPSATLATTDIATLSREWQVAVKAGNRDLARSINDRIVALKKGGQDTPVTPQSDSSQGAPAAAEPDVVAALEKLGMRNAEARGGQRWFMPSEGGLGLGDLYVDFTPDGEATISAHYFGKEFDSRKARGAAAISAAVERARDGIQAARLKIAQRELAKEQPALPAPLKERVAKVKARAKTAETPPQEAKRLAAEIAAVNGNPTHEGLLLEGYRRMAVEGKETEALADLRRNLDGAKRLKRAEARKAAAAPAPAPAPVETQHLEGKTAEPATAPVVAASLKKAARAEDRKPSEMKVDLLAQIDAAIAKAPETNASAGTTAPRTVRGKIEFSGSIEAPDGSRIAVEVRAGTKEGLWHVSDSQITNHAERAKHPVAILEADGPAAARRSVEALLQRAEVKDGRIALREADTVTFDVPGDGSFKVLNTADRLAEFRTKVEKSSGFSDAGQRTTTPKQQAPASAGTKAALENMVEEGDYQAALDYATAKGASLDDIKLSKSERSKFDTWLKANPQATEAATEEPAPAVGEQDRQGLRAEDRRLRDLDSAATDLAGQMKFDVTEGDFDAAEVLPGLRLFAEKAGVPADDLRIAVLRELRKSDLAKYQLAKLEGALDLTKQMPQAPERKPGIAGLEQIARIYLDRGMSYDDFLAGMKGMYRASHEFMGDAKLKVDELRDALGAIGYTEAGPLKAWFEDIAAGKTREVGAPMPRVTGIPHEAAQAAHAGTSHVPEVRAGQEQESFMNTMRNAWQRASQIAGTDPAALARITEEFEKLSAGYRQRYMAALGARSRIMSSMIVGPANFPVRRNEKRNETERKRSDEAQEYLQTGLKRLMRAAREPIDNSPASELDRVRTNLAEREAEQEMMKAANVALRKGDDAALSALGLSDEQIAKLKKPDFAGRPGFPDYQLKNNNAEIRRLRERLESANERVETAAAGPTEREVNGVTVREDAQADRLQLVFPDKPSLEMRVKLKKNGFRWAPSTGAWQRQLTNAARQAAEQVLGAGDVTHSAISAFNEVSNPDNGANRLPDGITSIKTGAQAVDWLAANMKDAGGRVIAERLRPHIGDGVSVNWLKAGDKMTPENASAARRLNASAAMVANLRSDGTVDIWAHTGKSMDESLLLHELIHAATMRALHGTKNATLRADLSNIVAAVQRTLRDVEYTDAIHVDERKAAAFFARVVDNEDELLAYAFSSPTLRRFMQNMNAQGKFNNFERTAEYLREKGDRALDMPAEPTLWQKFVDAIRSALGFSKMYAKRFEAALADREQLLAAFINNGKDVSLYERLDELLQQAMDANGVEAGPVNDKLQAGSESVMAGVVDAANKLADRLNKGPQIVGQTSREYTPEQLQAMRNVGFEVTPPTIQERINGLWTDAGKKMAQGLVDQFAPVKAISQTAYGLLRLSKGASGAFEAMLKGGKLKLTEGVYDFDETNPGGVIDKLLMPLHGEHHDFLRWVAANRAERLKGVGKENLFSESDIAALKGLSSGTTDFDYTIQSGARAGTATRDRTLIYADALRIFNEFNTNVLDMAEQSGLIDAEARALWENEFYVPFYRVEEDGTIAGADIKNGAVRQQAFKSLTGRTEKLNADLLDNTLMNWAHLLDAAAKNRAAKASVEAAEAMGAATKIDAPIGKGSVWFRENGEKRHSFVSDPHLLTAISALAYTGMRSPLMNTMGAFKRALTIGVTSSPFFKIRNLIRDSVQVIGTSGINANPLANIAQGWQLTDPKSAAYFRLLAGGGTIHFGTMMEGSEAKRVQALVESGVDKASILDDGRKVQAFYRKFVEPGITAYNELGNRGEAINRAALYDQLTRRGIGHAQASLMARDLMDFSMQGSFASIRFLTQVVPFFNARIQGLYKLGRAAKEDPARFSATIGATALASIALLAAFSDDDDWKKREDWDRNNYWWFKFAGMAFRIPKPFEIGAVATLAERGFELAFDKEMTSKRFTSQVLTLLGDNLSMNPIPQLVKPMLDVYANKSSFTGRPIEGLGMENLKPEYRFNQRTSMAARGLSTAANAVTGLAGADTLSPLQIDHLIQGYFGWLGSFVVGAGDVIARGATDQPTRPSPDYWKTATGGMAASLADAPSRYVSQIYTQAKELEEAYGTWRDMLKKGKAQEAAAFFEDNKEALQQYKRVEKLKRQESNLNTSIRMIESGPRSPDEKRDMIRDLQARKDQVARQLVTN